LLTPGILDVYNISNIYDFKLITSHNYGSYDKWINDRVVKDGTRIYVKHYVFYLSTTQVVIGIDISDFNNIKSKIVIGEWLDYTGNFYVENNVLYKFNEHEISIYNISNFSSVLIKRYTENVSEWELCGGFWDIEVKYGFVFVANPYVGFAILDMRNDDINFVSYFNTSNNDSVDFPLHGGKKIKVDGQQLYLADIDQGLMAFDIANLNEPKLLAMQNYSRSIDDLKTAGNLIFTVDSLDGFFLHKLASKEIIWPPKPLPPPTIFPTYSSATVDVKIFLSIGFMSTIAVIILFYRVKRRKINMKR
jgi:hypothetical protein